MMSSSVCSLGILVPTPTLILSQSWTQIWAPTSFPWRTHFKKVCRVEGRAGGCGGADAWIAFVIQSARIKFTYEKEEEKENIFSPPPPRSHSYTAWFFTRGFCAEFFAAASSVTAGRQSGGAKAAALIFGRHCQRCDRACRVTLTDLADEEAGRRMGDGSRRRSSAVPPRSLDSHLGPISQSARPDQPLAALKGRPLVFCLNRFKLPVILIASCLL